MNLLRHDPKGVEKPGLLDSEDRIRDLSLLLSDITTENLSPEGLSKLDNVFCVSIRVDGRHLRGMIVHDKIRLTGRLPIWPRAKETWFGATFSGNSAYLHRKQRNFYETSEKIRAISNVPSLSKPGYRPSQGCPQSRGWVFLCTRSAVPCCGSWGTRFWRCRWRF